MHSCRELGARMKSLRPCALLLRRRLVKLLLLTSTLTLCSNTEDRKADSIVIGGGQIDVFTSLREGDVAHADLINWVRTASESVTTYYGHYPVPYAAVHVSASDGRGVQDGRTFGWRIPRISISVSRDTSPADLRRDWTMTHEMVHLAFPSVAEKHHWIEEGTATYVEPIARVQAGYLAPAQMWGDLVRDLPQGLPGPGDRGLDFTHTWGRTYWGGALFCFLADVEIHRQSHNQKGLEDALRGILDAGGNITQDWPLERAFRVGDEATGTRVLEDLYGEMKDKPVSVDLGRLWRELGIQRSRNGGISFTDDGPLVSVRKSIDLSTSSPIHPEAAE